MYRFSFSLNIGTLHIHIPSVQGSNVDPTLNYFFSLNIHTFSTPGGFKSKRQLSKKLFPVLYCPAKVTNPSFPSYFCSIFRTLFINLSSLYFQNFLIEGKEPSLNVILYHLQWPSIFQLRGCELGGKNHFYGGTFI